MHSNQGSTNGTTIAIAVVIIVLIALGVWWYIRTQPPGTAAQNPPPGTPQSGQLQGTVQ